MQQTAHAILYDHHHQIFDRVSVSLHVVCHAIVIIIPVVQQVVMHHCSNKYFRERHAQKT